MSVYIRCHCGREIKTSISSIVESGWLECTCGCAWSYTCISVLYGPVSLKKEIDCKEAKVYETGNKEYSSSQEFLTTVLAHLPSGEVIKRSIINGES